MLKLNVPTIASIALTLMMVFTEYVGEGVNGKRHGKGKYTWTTGEKFQGQWATGLREGKGHLSYTVGTVHDGFWKDDEPEVE